MATSKSYLKQCPHCGADNYKPARVCCECAKPCTKEHRADNQRKGKVHSDVGTGQVHALNIPILRTLKGLTKEYGAEKMKELVDALA